MISLLPWVDLQLVSVFDKALSEYALLLIPKISDSVVRDRLASAVALIEYERFRGRFAAVDGVAGAEFLSGRPWSENPDMSNSRGLGGVT